jgi:outer membrane lipoprotein-sorting protein
MKALRLRAVLLAVSVLCAAFCGYSRPVRADDSPGAILQHARAVYGDLSSYSDSATVLKEYGVDSKDQQAFSTFFNRTPRHFLLDYRKQNGDRLVIWGDPEAFHSWWKTTGQVSDYPNPNNVAALTLNDFPTDGSITKIPTLLYPKASLAGALTHFDAASLNGTEDIGGQKCYRLAGQTYDVYGQSGKQVNFRKLTVWIDMQTFLVRQIREEGTPAAGSIDRTTTTYQPKANPAIAEGSFKFTPPNSK